MARQADVCQSIEAEQGIIGSILISATALQRAGAIIRTSDLYHEVHRRIWLAAWSLSGRDVPVDLISIPEALRERGDLEKCGGIPYLNSCVDTVPTATHVEYYAETVRELAIRRETIALAHEIPGLVKNGRPVAEVLAQVQDRITGLVDRPQPGRRLIRSAAEIMAMDLPDLRWVVPNLIPEGVTLLAGRNKLGKSWMAMQIAAAVAMGGRALGKIQVERGRCLYLALEDTFRRIQSRLSKACAGAGFPDRLDIVTDWRGIDDGGEQELEAYCRMQKPAVVIVDVLQKLRRQHEGRRSAYQTDYSDIEPYKRLADRHGASVLVIHHLNKQRDPVDPTDMVSGSTGLMGAVDGYMILHRKRGEDNAEIQVGGRDVEERRFALRWDRLTLWTLLGDADEVGRTREEQEVLALLAQGPATPRHLADTIGITRNTAGQRLRRMQERGLIVSRDGVYSSRTNPGLTQ